MRSMWPASTFDRSPRLPTRVGLSGRLGLDGGRILTARRLSLLPKGGLLLVACVACSPPPSVRAVDQWLSAYAAGDVETMIANTTPADRALVREAMAAAARSKTSSLALALPPQPIRHELLEIEKKSADGRRQVVLCRVTTKNPLPYMSERVGQPLDIPKTRTRRRRFLSIRGDDGQWGLKLDLERVIARTAFVERFRATLARRDYVAAERLLDEIPAPPDEANAQRRADRLRASLREALAKARRGVKPSRTASAAADRTAP